MLNVYNIYYFEPSFLHIVTFLHLFKLSCTTDDTFELGTPFHQIIPCNELRLFPFQILIYGFLACQDVEISIQLNE